MDEKTAMNVEFLRARLHSERIVSKTARQRAEMLSQRVVELEEQLRIVNIQRKKAEKAAEEVLSILETQGITCISGLTDSSTDREKERLTDKEGNQCIISEDVKEDKFLSSPRMDRSEVDDGLSCSDMDGSPSDYNFLSWKSSGNSLDSQEKLKAKQNRHRQRSSFISSLKSSQRRPGKSCRKIKRPDVRSASDNEPLKPTLHGDGAVAHSDDFDEKRECPLEASESKMDKFSVDGGGKDDMERALEQQAQFIIQFQTMENAQKEWEEKFNETKMSILDNHEPGNQIHVVENGNGSADNLKLVGWISQQENEEKISVKDISFTEDKRTDRCRNCEIADKKVTSDNLSPGVSSTSPSSPSRNGTNGRTNGLLNLMCESTDLDVIETVSKASTVPPQDNSDLARKVHLGPVFDKSNIGSASNLKVYSHDQVISSSKEFYAPDNKKILCGLEKPEIQQEPPPKHPSGLMEQQANNAAQAFTFPSQESLGLVATRKDLNGSIYEKPTAFIRRNSKANFREKGILQSSLGEKPTLITDEKKPNKELAEVKELHRPISRPTSSSLGSVLQSLQRARISIKQELVKRPNSAQGTLTVAAANPPIKANVPVDSSALFRLPSDSFPQALSGPNIYGSGLRLSATRPDLGFANTTFLPGDEHLDQSAIASYAHPGSKASFSKDYVVQYPFSPYMDGMSGFRTHNTYMNHHPARFVKSESQVSTVKDYFDLRSNSGVSASSATGYPLYYPGSSSQKLSLQNELSKSSSGLSSREPYSDRYHYSITSPSPI